MTKVKTILKEFCSAKDILAINRLGLLSKGEERESQPIPWRHRLKQGERKELVRSEMRMSLHRPSSRQSTKDKVKAVTTAQNPQLSRMGELLLHEHSKGGQSLDVTFDRLDTERRRSQSKMYHTRRSFLQQSPCLNREPLILVERPPHPNVRTRAAFMEKHGIDPELVSIPSYQRPLLTRVRTPSTLTTIEAFTVESRKKKNVWEEAVDEMDGVKFKTTVKPSARLTDHEKKQLKIGHTIHKPTPESIAEPRRPVKHKKPKPPRQEEEDPAMLRRSSGDSGATSPVFLTELSKRRPGVAKTPDGRRGRSLLSTKRATATASAPPKPTQTKYPFPPAVPHGISPRNPRQPQQGRSLSAGAGATRSGTSAGGKSLSKGPGGSRKLQKQHVQPSPSGTTTTTAAAAESSRVRGKKMKDFLSVLLEDEDD